MTERFTLDTNVLVYAHDFADARRQPLAEKLVRDCAPLDSRLTLQSIGEFYNAMTRKLSATPAEAAAHGRRFLAAYKLAEPNQTCVSLALSAAERGLFSYWDAFLLATAGEAGCTICFSEDMKDGARLGSIIVRNPFGAKGLSVSARRVLGTK